MLETPQLPPIKARLQNQMTLVLSVIIVGLMLLVSLPMVVISIRIQQQASAQARQALATQAGQTIGLIVQELQSNQLQTVITTPQDANAEFLANEIATRLNLTISSLAAQVQAVTRTQGSLESLFATNEQLVAIYQFSVHGNFLASYQRDLDDPLPGFTLAETSLRLTQQGLSTQNDVFFDQHNTPVVVVAVPAVASAGDVEGVILAGVKAPDFLALFADLSVSQSGYLYLADQAGRLIQPPSRLSQPTIAVGEAVPWQGQRGAYQGLNGSTVSGSAALIEPLNWQVIVEIPAAEANGPLRSLILILAAILMFGISVAIWLARYFSRRLLQPIHSLQESAFRITEGDLAHRVALDRDDEIGFLAAAINQMVASLEATITQLRRVSLNLLSAQEDERRRVAQEIHDDLGQMLTALRLNLWMGLQTTPDQSILKEAHQQATQIQEQARTLSHELRPAMLDDLGLLPTLEWYIDRFEQRANLAIVLDVNFDEEALSPTLKTVIYRIVVEALTNIYKHAQAEVVEITLQQLPDTLKLEIRDDGRGFNPAELQRGSTLGIAGMQERVNLLQGQFLLESKIGAGTTISITLPL